MVRKRKIPFALIRKVFGKISELSDNTYVVLVTKSLLRKWNAGGFHADSLMIIAKLNKVITCFYPTNTENSLKYSRFKGRKIIIIN